MFKHPQLLISLRLVELLYLKLLNLPAIFTLYGSGGLEEGPETLSGYSGNSTDPLPLIQMAFTTAVYGLLSKSTLVTRTSYVSSPDTKNKV